jgi:hypothetical protein
MKEWIEQNLYDKNGKLAPRKLHEMWFVKRGFESQYHEIFERIV